LAKKVLARTKGPSREMTEALFEEMLARAKLARDFPDTSSKDARLSTETEVRIRMSDLEKSSLRGGGQSRHLPETYRLEVLEAWERVVAAMPDQKFGKFWLSDCYLIYANRLLSFANQSPSIPPEARLAI